MDNNRYHPGVLNRLFKEVDNSPLIVFRVILGFLLFYHIVAALLNGTVYKNFIQPPFTFNFIGFDFFTAIARTRDVFLLWINGAICFNGNDGSVVPVINDGLYDFVGGYLPDAKSRL